LPDLSGKTVRLSAYRKKSNVVLMFGSVTCGATATQLRAGKPSIRSLYARYKKKGFEFFLIYTKEPHPGERIPQPTTIEERAKNAARLKQEENVNFPILIDTPDNAVRNAYRGWANGIFVVNKDGVLVFRSSWTHGPELAQVLDDLYAWEKAQARNELVRVRYSERIVGLVRNKKSAPAFIAAPAYKRFKISRGSSTPKEKSARSSGGIESGRRKTTLRANEVGSESAAMQKPEFPTISQYECLISPAPTCNGSCHCTFVFFGPNLL
jgi:hypothetical protein